MKLKKRSDCGSHGFHVSTIPKAPRSIRRRAQPKKPDEEGQLCAFELLASLARQLLQETESSSASSNALGNDHSAIGKDAIEDGQQYEDKPVKTECLDRSSCEVSAVVSESASQNCNQKCLLNEFPHAEADDILERASISMGSGSPGKVGDNIKSEICKSNILKGKFPSKVEGGSPNFGESCFNGVENAFEQPAETKAMETYVTTDISKDRTELCMTFPALTNSDKDVKLPYCRDPVPNASFSRHRNGLKLGSRDDDDNLSRFNKFSNKLKVYRPVTRVGDRRIRKLLTSKYWKVAPKLKDFEHPRPDGGMRPLHRKRKSCYNNERCHRDFLYKRRKFYDRSSVETFDGGFSCESVTNSPEKGRNGDKSSSGSMLQAATVMTSSVKGHQGSLRSKDSNVKFSIKSFRVPEIFIEVSEASTVGSLKRTVMDAVTAILGGGIRVGVLLHGKKVRDDNRTLSQTGLGSENNLDTLGFTLEPSAVEAPAPPPVCPEHPPLLLPDAPQLVARSPETLAFDSEFPNALSDPPLLTKTGTDVESNHEQAISHTDVVTDSTLPDSRALVAVPAMNVEALAMVPLNQKGRRSEIAQRRTRRPFSVSEVEALVQAVEELGTGRWRDVKLRSFEDADHRTYVDLKDKWKTLVHTAKISPQQRRGEPVPQELLDRVLAAHGYWSQHQAKQQGKHQAAVMKIEAPLTDPNGATGNQL